MKKLMVLGSLLFCLATTVQAKQEHKLKIITGTSTQEVERKYEEFMTTNGILVKVESEMVLDTNRNQIVHVIYIYYYID